MSNPGSLTIREETRQSQDWDFCSDLPVRLSPFHPLFYIQLVHTPQNKTFLILSWHHGVMDARGGDLLLQALGAREQIVTSLFPRSDPRSPGIVRLKRARASIRTISQQCKAPLARLTQPAKNHGKYSFSCRVLSFTEEETAKCLSIANLAGALFFSSLFFLAIAVRGFDAIMKGRGNPKLPYVIPVGQDNRKRARAAPSF